MMTLEEIYWSLQDSPPPPPSPLCIPNWQECNNVNINVLCRRRDGIFVPSDYRDILPVQARSSPALSPLPASGVEPPAHTNDADADIGAMPCGHDVRGPRSRERAQADLVGR